LFNASVIFARRLFRANSSFSWWAGFLGKGQVYAPVLRERVDYPTEHREIHCEFEPGNEPHWFLLASEECNRIIIPDQAASQRALGEKYIGFERPPEPSGCPIPGR
jgi:hypothetical protein